MPTGGSSDIGTGQSGRGRRIAEELYSVWREVYLSIGSAGQRDQSISRKGISDWFHAIGIVEPKYKTLN